MDVSGTIDSGIEHVIKDFWEYPWDYFTEEDVRRRLIEEIEKALTKANKHRVEFRGGTTSAVHAEYPTPFRCSMRQRSFRLLSPTDSKGRRGHFDIVVLNAQAAKECEFEVIRSQHYNLLLNKLTGRALPLPFLDCVIEIKLFRELAHPNRIESAKQQAEYAIQAVRKVGAALQNNDYYWKPFARRGIVLLYDNSELVHTSSVGLARSRLLEVFEKTSDWTSLPDTLSCLCVTHHSMQEYRGESASRPSGT